MKRIELLTTDKKESIDLDSIVKKDKVLLKNMVSNLDVELMEVEDSIKCFLRNPKLSLGSDFISLVHKKEEVEASIKRINNTIEEYL